MKKSIGVVHCIADCDTCDKEIGGTYRNMQALAALHAKTYKHFVRGEVGLAFDYDGREDDKEKQQ